MIIFFCEKFLYVFIKNIICELLKHSFIIMGGIKETKGEFLQRVGKTAKAKREAGKSSQSSSGGGRKESLGEFLARKGEDKQDARLEAAQAVIPNTKVIDKNVSPVSEKVTDVSQPVPKVVYPRQEGVYAQINSQGNIQEDIYTRSSSGSFEPVQEEVLLESTREAIKRGDIEIAGKPNPEFILPSLNLEKVPAPTKTTTTLSFNRVGESPSSSVDFEFGLNPDSVQKVIFTRASSVKDETNKKSLGRMGAELIYRQEAVKRSIDNPDVGYAENFIKSFEATGLGVAGSTVTFGQGVYNVGEYAVKNPLETAVTIAFFVTPVPDELLLTGYAGKVLSKGVTAARVSYGSVGVAGFSSDVALKVKNSPSPSLTLLESSGELAGTAALFKFGSFVAQPHVFKTVLTAPAYAVSSMGGVGGFNTPKKSLKMRKPISMKRQSYNRNNPNVFEVPTGKGEIESLNTGLNIVYQKAPETFVRVRNKGLKDNFVKERIVDVRTGIAVRDKGLRTDVPSLKGNSEPPKNSGDFIGINNKGNFYASYIKGKNSFNVVDNSASVNRAAKEQRVFESRRSDGLVALQEYKTIKKIESYPFFQPESVSPKRSPSKPEQKFVQMSKTVDVVSQDLLPRVQRGEFEFLASDFEPVVSSKGGFRKGQREKLFSNLNEQKSLMSEIKVLEDTFNLKSKPVVELTAPIKVLSSAKESSLLFSPLSSSFESSKSLEVQDSISLVDVSVGSKDLSSSLFDVKSASKSFEVQDSILIQESSFLEVDLKRPSNNVFDSNPVRPRDFKFEFNPFRNNFYRDVFDKPSKHFGKKGKNDRGGDSFDFDSNSDDSLFGVEVRRKGLFGRIGSFSSLESAFIAGKKDVFSRSAASFRVIDLSSGKPVGDVPFSLPKGLRRSKVDSDVFVEVNRLRINSSGELNEITFKGRSFL